MQTTETFHENIYDGPLFTVHTESGTVRTTIYHPFWVLSGYDLEERQAPRELSEREDQGLSLPGRWVNSHELRCGDVLIGQNGEQQTVLRIEQEFVSGFLVHNLTIREDHTFAVGPDAILVHNTGGCTPTPRKRSPAIRKEWEEANGKPWPKDPETGRNMDVAHKKPLADGGDNSLGNIEPLPHSEHMQGHIDNGDFRRWGARSGGGGS